MPACPGAGKKVSDVPAGSTLNSPGPGDAAVTVSAAVPASTSVTPETKPVPLTVNGGVPVRTGPPAGGWTSAAMLTGVEPLRAAPGPPLPTRSW